MVKLPVKQAIERYIMMVSNIREVLDRIRSVTLNDKVSRGEMIGALLAISAELDLPTFFADRVSVPDEEGLKSWYVDGVLMQVGFKIIPREFSTSGTIMYNLALVIRSPLQEVVTRIWEQQNWELTQLEPMTKIMAPPAYSLTTETSGETVLHIDFGFLNPGTYKIEPNFRAMLPE